MIEATLLILGAFLGVLVDIFFRHNILHFILKVKKIVARALDKPDPITDRPYQLRFGNIVTDYVSLYGTGELPLNFRHLRADFVDEFVRLPKDLDRLRIAKRKELQEKARLQKSNLWNGERFALISYYPTRYGITEEPGISFTFKLTDYAAFLGITLRLDDSGLIQDNAGNLTTIREKYFPNFDVEQPNQYVTHSFGLNLSVITKDNKMLFCQRNAFVAHKKRIYTVPMNEGMQYPQDIDDFGKPSFLKTVYRGLIEELGVNLNDLGYSKYTLDMLNFGMLASDNEYSLLGRVKLPLITEEVEEMYYFSAKDRGLETQNELYAVDYDPYSIIEFVSAHGPWSGRGLAVVYYSMVREWGYRETKFALSRKSFSTKRLFTSIIRDNKKELSENSNNKSFNSVAMLEDLLDI
jgi:hypothetical protein